MVGNAEPLGPFIVDSLNAMAAMLEELSGVQMIAVDCQGENLSRMGRLFIMAIAARTSDEEDPENPPRVWLVDVHTLEHPTAAGERGWRGSAFLSRSQHQRQTLKQLLESSEVEKVMWDARADADALWHQFGVRLNNVLDLQVAEVAHRRYVKNLHVERVVGLARCLEDNIRHLSPAVQFVDKKIMRMMCEQEPRFWAHRPLDAFMAAYCVQDVAHLFNLRPVLTEGLDEHTMDKVWAVSQDRLDQCLNARESRSGPERALAPAL